MKNITDWAILKAIAEHSPPHFADLIAERNIWARDKLDFFYSNNEKGSPIAHYGCPHCSWSLEKGHNCKECLWNKVQTKYIGSSCINVRFGGVSHDYINSYFKYFSIEYASNNVSVLSAIYYLDFPYLTKEESKIRREEYRACRRFLTVHIEWTNKYDWGCKLRKN